MESKAQVHKRIYFAVRIVAAILAVIWMVRIFDFSSADAQVSGTVSRSMSYNMIEKISRHLNLGWDEDKIESVAGPVEKYLRKAAHMYEYAVLSILLGVALDAPGFFDPVASDPASDKKRKRRILVCILTIFICLVYSVTDEYHQTFVDGRSGELRDVCLDTGGAVIGLVLEMIVTVAIKKHIYGTRSSKTIGSQNGK